MSDADYIPMSPELGPFELDPRSIQAFWHGYPSPLARWHLHDEYELHLIVASTGKVFVGDHAGDFAPGHLVMTGPLLPHNWVSETRPSDMIDMRDGVIQFRRNLIQSVAESAPEARRLLPLLDRAQFGIEFRMNQHTELEKWFDHIIDSEGIARVGLLLELLERLSHRKDYKTLSTLPPQSCKSVDRLKAVERVIQYVYKNHATDIRIDSLASRLGMSNDSFSRFFARNTGTSFTRFLNDVRVAHACELLSSSDRPITEICFDVGFNNVTYFNRRFRQIKNLTPSEYRKRIELRQGATKLSEE